jgi:hypothetical protein
MVLVDTSVWVDHFRSGVIGLDALLTDGQVVCHPFIIGELACGHLKNRAEILTLLQELPQAICTEDWEIIQFIDDHNLMGKGLGYIDIHLRAVKKLLVPFVHFFTAPYAVLEPKKFKLFLHDGLLMSALLSSIPLDP